MKRPKIGLVGYFGFGNIGDELFIRVHNQHLSEKYELEVVHDMLEDPYLSEKARASLDAFDAFLIGGGDLINPNAVSKLYWRQDYLSKPVFVHGIGCPNHKVKSSKSLSYYARFFAHDSIQHVCFRDVESKAYFDSCIGSKIASYVYPDPVFSLTLPEKEKTNSKIIGIVLRNHKSMSGSYEQLRSAVNEAKSLGYKVRIIVGATGKLGREDLDVSMRFADEGEDIVSSETIDDLINAISGCSFIFSMKFHVVVLGTLYGIPVAQLSSTQKNKNLFRYLQRPDLLCNYLDPELARKVPVVGAPIHSLLVKKLRRDSCFGYEKLIAAIDAVLM